MVAHYRPNKNDANIVLFITGKIGNSLEGWYGSRSCFVAKDPEVLSYRNCFMLRYAILAAGEQKKHILVKIRRNPKMTSLQQAIHADIHQNIPQEYSSLQAVYHHIMNGDENLGSIRLLTCLEKYHAIVMEEVPSRTLRQLMDRQVLHASHLPDELSDAARKTGIWLHEFHQRIHSTEERQYNTADLLHEVQEYAECIQACSHDRVRASTIVESFADKLKNIQIQRATFTQSHADMTCDNVLYSEERRVYVTDIKTRPAPIYSDLGLLLVHPETLKPQIFSSGNYYPESLLSKYRSQIMAGYFREAAGDPVLLRVYIALRVLDKWLMHEDLMRRYKGIKHLLSLPLAPYVSSYFLKLMKKHLANFAFIAAALDLMQGNLL